MSVECPVKICFEYEDELKQVLIKKSCNVEHVHEKENREWGLNDTTKAAIKHLFMMGTRTPIPIIHSLRDSVILSQISNINIDDIQKPTQLQVSNYLNNTLKKVISGRPTFNYGELFEYVDQHTPVPSDDHQPFVLAHFFNINDRVPSASNFKFSFSTKFLLQLARCCHSSSI